MKVNNIQRQPIDRSALQIFSTCNLNLNCPRANYVEMIRMNRRLNIVGILPLKKSVHLHHSRECHGFHANSACKVSQPEIK